MILRLLFIATLVFLPCHGAQATEKIKVLIVTGRNNHNWVLSTPTIQRLLEESGRFEVSVTTTPGKEAPKDAWQDWRPRFGQHDVVLSDYNGDLWPDSVKMEFVNYVEGGGRVVEVHAANNAFTGWKEYEAMTGLLWRASGHGDRIYFDKDLKPVRQPKGEGPAGGHGAGHEYAITTLDAANPIFSDLPKVWMHVSDELYHGQRGPAENMHILAAAFSSIESKGTGVYEPMVWWIPYGKGKVITLLPGHLGDKATYPTPYDCVGFRTILQRSVEWIVTGEVSIPKPANFPTADRISVVLGPSGNAPAGGPTR